MLLQWAVGVDGHGVPHELEHGDICCGVRVGEAVLERDAQFFCNVEDGLGLGWALAVTQDFTREFAVDDLELRGCDDVNAELLGDRTHEGFRGGRDDDDGVACCLVEVDELACLGIDGRGDDGVERLVHDVLDFIDLPAAHHGGELVARGIHLLARLAHHHVRRLGEGNLQRVSWRDESVVHELFAEGVRRRGCDDGLVQIEKRRDETPCWRARCRGFRVVLGSHGFRL